MKIFLDSFFLKPQAILLGLIAVIQAATVRHDGNPGGDFQTTHPSVMKSSSGPGIPTTKIPNPTSTFSFPRSSCNSDRQNPLNQQQFFNERQQTPDQHPFYSDNQRSSNDQQFYNEEQQQFLNREHFGNDRQTPMSPQSYNERQIPSGAQQLYNDKQQSPIQQQLYNDRQQPSFQGQFYGENQQSSIEEQMRNQYNAQPVGVADQHLNSQRQFQEIANQQSQIRLSAFDNRQQPIVLPRSTAVHSASVVVSGMKNLPVLPAMVYNGGPVPVTHAVAYARDPLYKGGAAVRQHLQTPFVRYVYSHIL
ncbi:uncharacterized protein TNIN_491481 [Trichonephila inaurata madagascariensis]|uniref:Uncharacterized protein n=1 Tax=Trichonephila inaurata madagascariensis TaxID=2747483 RepID=A0A8X6X673_9ARAC|nr:uncharacterized protein TNIN_491481 [Trichonephila inaurata madagascariensis]